MVNTEPNARNVMSVALFPRAQLMRVTHENSWLWSELRCVLDAEDASDYSIIYRSRR